MYVELMLSCSHMFALCIVRSLAGFVSTLGHADFDIRDEVYRKGFGELINVLGVDLLWLVLA